MLSAASLLGQVSMTASSGYYSQNFNTLSDPTAAATAAWTNNSTLPGWYSSQTVFRGGGGTVGNDDMYSFGNTAGDRALGSVAGSGTGTISYGVQFQNTSGTTIDRITFQYTGEQWQDGAGVGSVVNTLAFSYQVSASALTDVTSGTYTTLTAGDFRSKINTQTGGGNFLNANDTSRRRLITVTFAVSIPNGQHIMLRWQDPNDTDNDHGIAVDDLLVTWETAAAGDEWYVWTGYPNGGYSLASNGPPACLLAAV